MSIGIALLFACPPALERGEEGLDTGIGSMGMQLLACEELHQVFGAWPDMLVPDCTPEEDDRLAIELATFSCQFIQLCCFADLEAAHPVVLHMCLFLLSIRKAAIRITRGARISAGIRLTARFCAIAACAYLKPSAVTSRTKVKS